jgi:hypothetical protein
MGKRDELNELAMVAIELRRQNMTVAKIALFLAVPEIKIWRLLARARKLFSLLTKDSDSETNIGENLSAFVAMERKAMEKFAMMNPSSNAAIGYLNAAKDARKEIKKLMQESGLMKKVADKVEVSGLPIQHDPVRDALYTVLELAEEFKKKQAEHEPPKS